MEATQGEPPARWDRARRTRPVCRPPSLKGLNKTIGGVLAKVGDQALITRAGAAYRNLCRIRSRRALRRRLWVVLRAGLCFGYVQELSRHILQARPASLLPALKEDGLFQAAVRMQVLSVYASRLHRSDKATDREILGSIYAELPQASEVSACIAKEHLVALGEALSHKDSMVLQIHCEGKRRGSIRHTLLAYAYEESQTWELFDSYAGNGLYHFGSRADWMQFILWRMRYGRPNLVRNSSWILQVYTL